jgi:hypothetical protein
MSIKHRIDRIWSSLDLGYSDAFPSPGENVRKDTLRRKLVSMEKAVRIIDLAEAVDFSLWNNLSEHHPSAEIYALDFPSPLRASAYLLLGGYYRQANSLLRDWFDMRLLGIYFGLVDRNPRDYQDWKNGADARIGKRLIGALLSLVEFRRADNKVGLRGRLEATYKELSKFTHGAGLEKYDLQHQTDNVPRFNPKSVGLWVDLLQESSSLVFSCLLVAYGSKAWLDLDKKERSLLRRETGVLYAETK